MGSSRHVTGRKCFRVHPCQDLSARSHYFFVQSPSSQKESQSKTPSTSRTSIGSGLRLKLLTSGNLSLSEDIVRHAERAHVHRRHASRVCSSLSALIGKSFVVLPCQHCDPMAMTHRNRTVASPTVSHL